MTSQAFDATTVCRALAEFTDKFYPGAQWAPSVEGGVQGAFLDWYRVHGNVVRDLNGLQTLASADYAVLNAFLEEHGFEPLFQPYPGVGVASILRLLVEWTAKADVTTITPLGASDEYPAFRLGESDIDIFEVLDDPHPHPLLRLRTQSGHSVWLTKAVAEPKTGVELLTAIQALLDAPRQISYQFAGATVPMIEIDLKPDLAWMLGARIEDDDRTVCTIGQAFQQFYFGMNESGALAKVATGLAPKGAISMSWPYLLDEPLIGFVTQGGILHGASTLPMAGFYADLDCWRRPTAEELVNL